MSSEILKIEDIKVGDNVEVLVGCNSDAANIEVGMICKVVAIDFKNEKILCYSDKIDGHHGSSFSKQDNPHNWFFELDQIKKVETCKRHKHADIMIAYANDKTLEIEEKFSDGDWNFVVSPAFHNNLEYRIKPKTKILYELRCLDLNKNFVALDRSNQYSILEKAFKKLSEFDDNIYNFEIVAVEVTNED